MGRNLYILGGTLGTLALLSIALSFSGIGEVPGTPSDASLWRTTGVALLAIALMVSLAGVLSSLFAQAERRAAAGRQEERAIRQATRRPGLREEREERARRSGESGRI